MHSIHLVDLGTKLDHRPELSGNTEVKKGIQPRGRCQQGQDLASRTSDSRHSPLVTVQNAERVITNNKPQVKDPSLRSEAMHGINRIFDTSRYLTDCFVGRERILSELVSYLYPSTQLHTPLQTSVILSGLGGIGKTQVALKVAHTLRDFYFAVFWVDASSDVRARASWADIARNLNIEPNFQHTYDYLLTLKRPWLAIVDNMDSAHMRAYIPSGEYGRVIITTRVGPQILKNEGIIAEKRYGLDIFSEEESFQLLSRLGVMIESESKSLAKKIAETLGHHPLALTQIASYMRSHAISPAEFLKSYHSKMKKASQASSPTLSQILRVSIEGLDDDALQMLKLISVFNCDNIPIEVFFVGCHKCSDISPEKDSFDEENSFVPNSRPSFPLVRQLCSIASQLSNIPMIGQRSQTPAVSPRILRSSTNPRVSQARIHAALTTLREHAFILMDPGRGTIQIHRLLVEYVMTTFGSLAEKAVTCEAALTILSYCIQLENQTFGNAILYAESRNLLPHMHLPQWSQVIQQSYYANQQSIGQLRSMLPKFGWQASTSIRSDPLRLMKFSIVCFTGAEYQSARVMQEEALSLLLQHWGTMQNYQCVHTSSALALTYHRLHVFDQAIEMQRQAIPASELLYGKEHNLTLSMIDVLGLFYLSRGDLIESLQYSQQARSGLKKLYEHDPEHKAALTALNHLGAVQAQYYRWKESRELCKAALEGLRRIDPKSSEIWLAKQNIAIATIHLNERHSFAEAEALITDVWSHWKDSLGDHHPSTILAVINRSRISFYRGMISKAETLLLPALRIAETRLGTKHFSILSARMLLACIKLSQRNHTLAEEILVDVIGIYTELEYAKNHMDRIATLWYLIECYKEQYRFDEALEVWEEMSDSLKLSMNFDLRVKHPLAKNLHLKRQELEALKQRTKIAVMRALESEANGGPQIGGTAPQVAA